MTTTPDDILTNADRLIADARYLHTSGRSRSAATLVVVALEQFGAFIEEIAKEKYPNPNVHMGIFGPKPNAHAKRQDALAAHIMNYAMMRLTSTFLFEIFYEKTGCCDAEKHLQWMIQTAPIEFTEDQKQRMKQSPEMKTATLLMHAVRQNRLQKLREYGLYENSDLGFTTDAIAQAIELAERTRDILRDSRNWVTPDPILLAGVNLPEDLTLE